MSPTATQINCPFCNATQAAQSGGQYTCEFCLQPFTVVDAQREESRLLEDIKRWVEQRVGAAAMAPGGVDASSRGFIFQQRILPDLRRDVDRSLEMLGSYGQFPLVVPPVRVAQQTARFPNPLVAYRRQILDLRGLRARLGAEQVTSFAVRDLDQAAIQAMDRHLGSLIHLSNVAEAAASYTPQGYAAARRNLATLASEVSRSLALEGAQDPALAVFLSAMLERYRQLAEICRISEETCSPNAVSGGPLADRAEAIANALWQIGRTVEASNYSPADTMPVVIGLNQEAIAARTLARWLRAYDGIAGRVSVPFLAFAREVDALTGGGTISPDVQVDLVEQIGWVLRAVRGETTLGAVNDFSWVSGWVEATREKKSLGLFGAEERPAQVDQFLVPVWVADVSFSRATGAIFTAGQETRAVALVDACAPEPAKVVVLDGAHQALGTALATPQVVAGAPVAMPASTPTQAHGVIVQAIRARPEFLNAQVRVRGVGLLPAAVAHLTTGQRARQAAACMNAYVPLGTAARTQLQVTQQLLQRFG